MYNSHNINPYRYKYTYVLTDLCYIHTCIVVPICYTYSYNSKLLNSMKLNQLQKYAFMIRIIRT